MFVDLWTLLQCTEIFRKVEKNLKLCYFLFYPLTLNIIWFVEKNIFCIFESVTVKISNVRNFGDVYEQKSKREHLQIA